MALLTEQLNNYQASGNPNPVDAEDIKLDGSPSESGGEPQKPVRNVTGFGPLGNIIIQGGGNRNDFTPESYVREAAEAGWGESRYDPMTGYVPGANIEDVRANAQPWYWKIGNGIAKGGVTAATTAVNTVAGTVFGIGSSLFEMANQISSGDGVDMKKVLDSGVNNFLSEQLIKIQNFSEELFPNYRTKEEQSEEYQKEWYKHIGTANFIGDSFLKNFGFTIGAMAGGAVWSNLIGKAMAKGLASNILKGAVVGAEGDAEALAALRNIATAVENGTVSTIDATKLATNLADAVKKINKMEARLQLYGAVIGAMGEGTTEGIMAKDEFLKEYMPELERMYQAKMDKVESDVLSSSPVLGYSVDTGRVDEDGNPVRILTRRGQDEVNKRKNNLANEYMEAQGFANEQGDRLASTTFLLNLPILTASNTIQFGRMFSKGWRTARKQAAIEGGTAIAEAAGKDAKLALNAAYKATGTVGGRTVLNSLKVAGSESFEEMAQGAISSGAKNVAATRLAAFNNDAYDPDAVGQFGDWFAQMQEGGVEYLSDVKNWQEGFMGAVTGLLGIPSRSLRTWNGGVIGAYNEAKGERSASEAAAELLNSKVNSEEFQNRWHGYIRHMKYDNDMEKAANRNNPYDWHNANDKQLISDIIAFDNAGKLDDLLQIVDAYANISTADAAKLKPALGNENGKKSDEDIVREVKERATKFKNTINEYKEIYESLSARMKPGTSQSFLEETVFTANQIKLAEHRFLELFDETMGAIDKAFGSSETDTEELVKIYNSLSKYFTGNIIPGNLTKEEKLRVDLALDTIKHFAGNKAEVTQKIADMQKLSDDRAALYRKLVTLEGTTQENFDKEAIKPDKVVRSAIGEQIRREAEMYSSVEDVKVAYRGLPKDRSMDKEFFDVLLEMEGENPNVKAFLELNAAYQDFLESYQVSQFRIPDDHIVAHDAQKFILDDIYDSIESREDLLGLDMDDYLSQDPNRPTQKEQEILMQLRATSPGGLSDVGYARAVEAVRNGLDEYKNKLNFVGQRPQAEKKKQQQRQSQPPSLRQQIGQQGNPSSRPPGLRQTLGVQGTPAPATNAVKDKLGRDWVVGQKAYLYKLDDDGEIIPVLIGEYKVEGFYSKSTQNNAPQVRLVDANGKRILVDLTADNISRLQTEKLEEVEPVENPDAFIVDNPTKADISGSALEAVQVTEFASGVENEVDTVAELSGKGDLHYLRTGMPEIDSFAAKRARDIARDKNYSLSDKKGKLADVDLRDFFEIKPSYEEIWKALQSFEGQNAFENVANILEENDEIEFRINDKFPKLHIEGQPEETQVLLYTKKNGKDYLLTTLVRDTSLYNGLQGLREAIFEKYRAWQAAGNTGEFIFKDNDGKPITTTVWAKRSGFVVYNQNDKSNKYNKELPINGISGYDPSAPIVFVDRSGSIRPLNNADVDPSVLGDTDDKRGHLYYLAKGIRGTYVPIRLGVEHFNHDTKKYTNPAFESIKSEFSHIVEYIKSVSNQNIASFEDRKAVRDGLSPYLKNLSKVLDIHNDVFTLYADKRTGKMKLAIYSQDAKPYRIDADKINTDWLINAMASRNRSINIDSETDIDSLVKQDMITSNAVAMRPKGVDFYTYPWDESKNAFEPYHAQKTISDSVPVESSPASAEPTKEELEKEMKEKKTTTAAAPTEKREPKNPETPEPAAPVVARVVKSLDWTDFSEDIQNDLAATKGYDEETWDLLSEAAKRNELDCIGVSSEL